MYLALLVSYIAYSKNNSFTYKFNCRHIFLHPHNDKKKDDQNIDISIELLP